VAESTHSLSVLGPTFSFIAVASIIVDYVLTACIFNVMPWENGLRSFRCPACEDGHSVRHCLGHRGLNILGIKENARFTFGIFFVVRLCCSPARIGVLRLHRGGWDDHRQSYTSAGLRIHEGDFSGASPSIIVGVASCILAYSGIESVVQTAGLSRAGGHRKAYIFLAVTTGFSRLSCPRLSSAQASMRAA